MAAFYKLIHLPSGNVVGDFDSQDESLVALRRITDGETTAPLPDFALMRCEGDQQELVATRDELSPLSADLLEPVSRSA